MFRMISAQTTAQASGLGAFFSQYGLLIVLVVLLVFMLWSSNRRRQKMKLEQEERARQTVPGAEVLLQGGLYGTIVAYDPDNLDQPAIVELAPGVEIKVHSQAILRVITPSHADETLDAPAVESIDEPAADVVDAPADDVAPDVDGDADSKPKA
jgi:preprotein translocase subunit YajC